MVRSAGNSAQLMAKEGAYAQVRLPSGEVRLINENARRVSVFSVTSSTRTSRLAKPAVNRHKGIRPSVRGVVMSAVDHPHGGGDGGRHGMAKAPRTPWGQKTLGYKTRRRKSTTNSS